MLTRDLQLSDNFQDFYRTVYNIAASSDVITHCKRELFQLVWLLILDDEFMHAYVLVREVGQNPPYRGGS